MANLDAGGLQGRTLKVYLFVVKERNPVGPREVMRGVNLSSPSVAYRHLQKLETMGLLVKNEFGNYVAKEKAAIRGYVWFGRRLVPNAIVYSLVFLVILFWEFVVFMLHFSVETNQFKIFFFLLMAITISAIVLFTIEGLRSLRRTRILQSESP
ncbi:hypothetical protein MUO71_00405 [Candidatus Bathyarchaeota archaeon]|nr:hypothetical protein [Candidatus Bathyarchaeota archaeon]